MPSFSRHNLILVRYPFSDLSSSKVRPAVIVNAEFDPLRDDGILYANKLRNAGVRVWEKCFPGQIHCLIGALPNSPVMMEYAAIVKAAMNESFQKQ